MGKDYIGLTVPAKPEYILVTRLTASAVASRLGFDIDAIEDIKIAVAEAATLLINENKSIKDLKLNFYLGDKELSIEIERNKDIAHYVDSVNESDLEQKEMSMFILKSIMDDVKMHMESGTLSKICMNKSSQELITL